MKRSVETGPGLERSNRGTWPRGNVGLRDLITVAVVLVIILALWQTADSVLLILAGLLFGIFLDSLVQLVQRAMPVGRAAALTLICLCLAILLTASFAWGAYLLSQQWDVLADTLTEQIQFLRQRIENIDLQIENPQKNGERTLTDFFLPDPGRLFGSARSAFAAAFGVLGAALIVLLIGIFYAANPELYKSGLLKLIAPTQRPRISEVLDEIIEMERWWLLGQLVAMILIGATVWLALSLLGLPAAMLLGVQAGIFNFIPYLGAFVAAVPILLAAIPQGIAILLWVLAAYVLIQVIEGYVLNPLIQKRAVHLSPVTTLAAVILFGALFGALGAALATPLAAALRIAVLRLYVEDRLEAEPA